MRPRVVEGEAHETRGRCQCAVRLEDAPSPRRQNLRGNGSSVEVETWAARSCPAAPKANRHPSEASPPAPVGKGCPGAWGSRWLPGGKCAFFYSINIMRAFHPSWFLQDLESFFHLPASGATRPRVAERISFDGVAEAHRRLEAGGLKGSSSCARISRRRPTGCLVRDLPDPDRRWAASDPAWRNCPRGGGNPQREDVIVVG